jgi:ABC-type transport system involved in cytochrome c biogenesis permease subunit
MSLLDLTLSRIAVVAYFAAAALTGLGALLGRARLNLLRNLAVTVGFSVHTAALIIRTTRTGRLPLTDLFEYTLFMAWALVLAYLLFFRKRLPAAGTLTLLIVVFLLLGSATYLFYSDPSGGMMPALKSNWLYIHVSLAALGEVFFAIGFASSLIYLIRKRSADQASLDAIDDLTYRAVSMGFPLFTAGAMVAGAIWAKQAWGSYWSWDPKEVLSLGPPDLDGRIYPHRFHHLWRHVLRRAARLWIRKCSLSRYAGFAEGGLGSRRWYARSRYSPCPRSPSSLSGGLCFQVAISWHIS